MVSMYKWQRIKALHAQGVSIRQIAATVGVSRNTVRKYLREAGPPQFKGPGSMSKNWTTIKKQLRTC
ncbi:MAG: helix-turn-helix domain-containing protein [Limnochordia bacterium]